MLLGGRPQTAGCLPVTTVCFKKYLTIETGLDAHLAVECHGVSATWHKQYIWHKQKINFTNSIKRTDDDLRN